MATAVVNRSTAHDSSDQKDVCHFNYEGKCLKGKRETSYLSAVQTCRALFPDIPESSTITFYINDGLQGDRPIITDDCWKNKDILIASVIVEIDVPEEESDEEDESAEEMTDEDEAFGSKGEKISLRFLRDECNSHVKISPDAPVSQLFALAGKLAGAYTADIRMEFDGKRIPRNYNGSVSKYGIRDGDYLYFDVRC